MRQPTDGPAGYALNPRKAQVRLLQCYAGGAAVYLFDMRSAAWSTVLPLFHGNHVMAGFNLVFDLSFMMNDTGVIPTAQQCDVQLAMRLVDPCEAGLPSMQKAASLVLGVEPPKMLGASDWSQELTADQLEYAALDAVITYRLWHKLWRVDLDDQDKYCLQPAQGALIAHARMQLFGMPVNVTIHDTFIETWQRELIAAQERLSTTTNGILTGNPTDAEVRAYLDTVLTPEQLAQWPVTKSMKLQTNKRAFAAHGCDIPGILELRAVRMWFKGLSTYGPAFRNRVEGDRLHGQFTITGARSGRTSSRQPNMQNLPGGRSGALAVFREMFEAPEGQVVIAADYSQIELRVVAELADDFVMKEAYRRYGEAFPDKALMKANDLHATTAASMRPDFHLLPSAEQDSVRGLAKSMNFGLIYGSGPAAFSAYCATTGIFITVDEARDVIEKFKETYPGIAQWQFVQSKQTKACGYVTTVLGRRWYWGWRAKSYSAIPDAMEDFKIENFLAGFERNYSLNHPVQGTAAEIMLHATALVDEALRATHPAARICAVVHDEIVLTCSAESVTNVENIVTSAMTTAWRDVFPEAEHRAVVEVKHGSNWRQAH
jgi:DNA polymerase-1